MDRFTGGCLCGSVRLTASGPPYRVGICHCLDCRKHHGALFHASAIFPRDAVAIEGRSEEHTSELQSLMRIPYAVFCLKKKNPQLALVRLRTDPSTTSAD